MAKVKTQDRCARARIVLALIDKYTTERKALYDELDLLIGELRQVPNLAAQGLAIKDAFAKSNTAWGHGPVRQFTLELLEASPAADAVEAKPAVDSEVALKRRRSEKKSQ